MHYLLIASGLLFIITAFIFLKKLSRSMFYFLTITGFILVLIGLLSTIAGYGLGGVIFMATYMVSAVILCAITLIVYEYIKSRKSGNNNISKPNLITIQVMSVLVFLLFLYRVTNDNSFGNTWGIILNFFVLTLSSLICYLAYKKNNSIRYLLIVLIVFIILALLFG